MFAPSGTLETSLIIKTNMDIGTTIRSRASAALRQVTLLSLYSLEYFWQSTIVLTVTHWKVKTMMASAEKRFGRRRTTRYQTQGKVKAVSSR
jgi:hypothetical protein